MNTASTSQQAWTGKTRGGVFGYAFFKVVISILGRPAAYLVLYVVVAYYFIKEQKVKKASRTFIRHVHPSISAWKTWCFPYHHFYMQGKLLIDRAWFLAGNHEPQIESIGREGIHEAVAQQKGILVLSGHFGGWELIARFMGDIYGLCFNVMMYQGDTEAMQRFLDRTQTKASNLNFISLDDGLTAYLTIHQKLRNQEGVVTTGDRVMNDQTLTAMFLGKPARFPRDPFRLAAKVRCPIILSLTTRKSMNRFTVESVTIDPEDEPYRSMVDDGLAEKILSLYIELFEKKVRDNPAQWLNFYDFWQ